MTGTLAVDTRLNCTRFEVAYLGAAGVEYRESLAGCWNVRFEDVLPVRSFPAFKGQGSFPGWWYSSTMDCHVGYESWTAGHVVSHKWINPDGTQTRRGPASSGTHVVDSAGRCGGRRCVRQISGCGARRIHHGVALMMRSATARAASRV